MSGFDAQWLALREGADRRARSTKLVRALADWLAARGATSKVVDLGCGTGANMRFVAPLLSGEQRWTCVDDDPALLALLRETSLQHVIVDARREDLSRRLDDLGDTGPDAIVASALLDLVSERWLAALVALSHRCSAAVLFALSYDGRLELHPAQASDALVLDAFNAHQRRDKGFGPALGPHACSSVTAAFQAAGYEVRNERSNWRLDANDADGARLIAPLVEGIAQAAMEQWPAQTALFESWRSSRREQCAKGTLRLTVGHEDVLGLPGIAAPSQ